MKVGLLALVIACVQTFANAQDANPYVGTWRAEYTTKNGATRDGKVVISEKSGTWDMAGQVRNNPCLGRAYPITVVTASSSELKFEINRAKTLAGCKDGVAMLRRIDERTLEGEFDETKLKLIRQ